MKVSASKHHELVGANCGDVSNQKVGDLFGGIGERSS